MNVTVPVTLEPLLAKIAATARGLALAALPLVSAARAALDAASGGTDASGATGSGVVAEQLIETMAAATVASFMKWHVSAKRPLREGGEGLADAPELPGLAPGTYSGPMRHPFTVALGVLCSLGLMAAHALADASLETTHPFDRVFSTAVRMVRVDQGCKIVDRDPEMGFFTFEYKTPGSSEQAAGAVEFVRGTEKLRVVIKLPSLPSYHEGRLVDALRKKLEAEYGPDPIREKPPAPPEKKDPEEAK